MNLLIAQLNSSYVYIYQDHRTISSQWGVSIIPKHLTLSAPGHGGFCPVESSSKNRGGHLSSDVISQLAFFIAQPLPLQRPCRTSTGGTLRSLWRAWASISRWNSTRAMWALLVVCSSQSQLVPMWFCRRDACCSCMAIRIFQK